MNTQAIKMNAFGYRLVKLANLQKLLVQLNKSQASKIVLQACCKKQMFKILRACKEI
jgi:hypothetical protein